MLLNTMRFSLNIKKNCILCRLKTQNWTGSIARNTMIATYKTSINYSKTTTLLSSRLTTRNLSSNSLSLAMEGIILECAAKMSPMVWEFYVFLIRDKILDISR